MNLVPLSDRVVVEQIEESNELAKGIIRPDTVTTEAGRGRILAIGKGKLNTDGSRQRMEDFQVGDIIRYAKYTGSSVKIDHKEYLIMPQTFIIAREQTRAEESIEQIADRIAAAT